MLTLLLYVLIVGLVAALLFLVVSALFGRSEELGPLPEGTTATVLPAERISGADVRALRFQQVVRGYKAGEVDWALTRLAARIDELESQLAHAVSGDQRLEVVVSNGAALPAETPVPRRVAPEPTSDVAAPLPEVLPGHTDDASAEPGAR
ncbi:DivIVA domain-containing protein [Nocardia sp. SYP-A9097]|uniref:DivIVA domain-containing protein n=1 Tax=Nocardia sp. SYP-A9097 TaxID=2663237 RepID=UPI00129A5CCE|nr:DivIVA domain-containing protein [Nocardia sp. SYP-A9097]MRH91170.1 DivIVA domain-containing protein [Nocardia sp. SYP-A9097]